MACGPALLASHWSRHGPLLCHWSGYMRQQLRRDHPMFRQGQVSLVSGCTTSIIDCRGPFKKLSLYHVRAEAQRSRISLDRQEETTLMPSKKA